MSYLTPTTSLQPIERISQGATDGDSQRQSSSHNTSIHILDDDSLLHVFYLYRPCLFGEDDTESARLFGWVERCIREYWWYDLAHVCQRWRNIILGSASYLDVCLVCTYGTPVADMLAHSPPLPFVVDISDKGRRVTAKDEEGTILALKQRDRVRRVRLDMPKTNLKKLVVAIDGEYPILEYLVITYEPVDYSCASTVLRFPEIFRAPHLRHLSLGSFVLPIGSQLLTTAVGLVTLCLYMPHTSSQCEPNTLLQWFSFMPQLEVLALVFSLAVTNQGPERQLTTRTPIMTPVTLPNLHRFWFQGTNAYLEALVHQISTPLLEKLRIDFFNQLTFSLPRLAQVVNTTENLRFDSAELFFSMWQVYVRAYPRGEPEMHALAITVHCRDLNQQVTSVAQISSSLSQILTAVEHLSLEHDIHSCSSGGHNEIDLIDWRKLLRSFSNVKTLRIDNCFLEEISCCLQLDGGKHSLELLPELREIFYGSGRSCHEFNSSIDTSQNADRSITLVGP